MSERKTEVRWVVVGNVGLYTGQWLHSSRCNAGTRRHD